MNIKFVILICILTDCVVARYVAHNFTDFKAKMLSCLGDQRFEYTIIRESTGDVMIRPIQRRGLHMQRDDKVKDCLMSIILLNSITRLGCGADYGRMDIFDNSITYDPWDDESTSTCDENQPKPWNSPWLNSPWVHYNGVPTEHCRASVNDDLQSYRNYSYGVGSIGGIVDGDDNDEPSYRKARISKYTISLSSLIPAIKKIDQFKICLV